MTYHFPSFVWRDWSEEEVVERRDRRKKSDGSPWRRSENLSYLRANTPSTKRGSRIDVLHETQQSLTIRCYDRHMWTLHSLNDSYFYEPDPNNEDTLEYYEYDESVDDPDVQYDPITLGKSEPGKPVDNPLEYSFFLLKVRVYQLLDEWRNIGYQLQNCVSAYVSRHFPF